MNPLRYLLALGVWIWLTSGLLTAQVHPAPTSRTHPLPQHRCGTSAASQQLWQDHPQLQQLNTLVDNALFEHIRARAGKHPTPLNGDQVYTIPVVVHIVHNDGDENISDSQVLEGIRHLNEAFAGLQLDASSTVTFTLCMARQDAAGMPTNGITRHQSPLTNMVIEVHDNALKNISRWDPTKYLNIWIVRDVASSSVGPTVTGYARLPASHGNPDDGVVIEARYFGSSPANSTVAIHEVGHYFGLYDTFHGGCGNGNCLLDGDRVCDTPPDASTSGIACDAPMNSCISDPDDESANNPFRPVAKGGIGDQRDMISNFMDEGNAACMEAFTPGQAQRMVAALLEIRKSLLISPGCDDPCPTEIIASFTSDRDAILSGETVQFTNNSSGATTYSWRVDNTEFATSEDASHLFTSPGTYIVSLRVANEDIRCVHTAYDTIVVTCGVRALFTANPIFVEPGEEVRFANTSSGATIYTWLVNGQQKATTKEHSEIFATGGVYTILLIASNGACADTAYAFINVGSCVGRQSNIWYFGDYSGLNFSTDPPTVLTNGQLTTSEGCATICNSAGQLLFYTDGYSVWNRQHQIMPNGAGTLAGHSSSTQSAAIIPYPGKTGFYHVFTVDAAESPSRNGLSYAIIDMSLHNGTGDVVSVVKKVRESVGERLVTVPHSDEESFWVVVRDAQDQFYSYLVNSSGLVLTPVISKVSRITGCRLGAMKVSSRGDRIAVANYETNDAEVYSFNPATGVVSETGSFVLSDIQSAYGVEFSPDGSLLYVSQPVSPAGIYQYDLTAGNAAAIEASKYFIEMADIYEVSSLQLGPDGRIYASRYGTPGLGAIMAPNKLKAECDYRDDFLILPNPATYGLPPLVHTTMREEQRGEIMGASSTTACLSATSSFTFTGGTKGTLRWLHHGNNSMTYSKDSSTIYIQSATPGIDTVIAVYGSLCNILSDTVVVTTVVPPTLSLGDDTSICDNQPVTLDAGPGFASYRWQNGTKNRTFRVTIPGEYWVTGTTAEGCVVSDTIVIHGPTTTSVSLGPDVSMCAGGVFAFDAGPGFRSYRWQDGSTEQRLTAYRAGTYWVEAETYCDEVKRDTVVVEQAPAPVQTSGDAQLCIGGSVQLSASANATDFLWSPPDGLDDPTSATPTASPENTTTYTVKCTSLEGCRMESSLTVTVYNLVADVSPDTTICPGGRARLAVFTPATSFRWSPAEGLDDPTSATPTASPQKTTTYTVQCVSDEGCEMESSITVAVYDLAAEVSPDTAICPGGTAQLFVNAATPSLLWTPAEGLSDPTSATPTASPQKTTTYTARYTSPEGCELEGRVIVTVLDKNVITLSIPDTTASPGADLRLPVYLDVAPDLLPLRIPSLTFTVRYRFSFLKITRLTAGNFGISSDGAYEVVSVELRDLNLTRSRTAITHLAGLVFLGDTATTALEVGNAIANNCFTPVMQNGSFASSGLCNMPARQIRLLDRTAPVLAVTPNPAGDETSVAATTSEEGVHTLVLYDLHGQVLWRQQFVHNGSRSTHTLPAVLRGIPAGLYHLVLTTPSQTATTTISVVK